MAHLGAHHGLRTQVLGEDGNGQVEAAETVVDGFEAVSGSLPGTERNRVQHDAKKVGTTASPVPLEWYVFVR